MSSYGNSNNGDGQKKAPQKTSTATNGLSTPDEILADIAEKTGVEFLLEEDASIGQFEEDPSQHQESGHETEEVTDYLPKIDAAASISGATTTDSFGPDTFSGKVGFGNFSKMINPFDGKLSKDWKDGHDNTKIKEKIPAYNKAACEKVFEGLNNTLIVLGRDRDKGWSSGYGGKGHTRAGAIDIVVGLQGWEPSHEMKVERNFGSMGRDIPGDAARIYISQRADIDRYFDICKGSLGNSKAMSAIGIKADSVRLMARRGIKLVTGQAPQQRTSLSGKIPAQFGIDLIAGNRDEVKAVGESDVAFVAGRPVTTTQPYLQSIPKGQNLTDCLLTIIDQISALSSLCSDFMLRQVITNAWIVGSPSLGTVTGEPSMSTAIAQVADQATKIIANDYAELAGQRVELVAIKSDYLIESGPIYINSRFNRTN